MLQISVLGGGGIHFGAHYQDYCRRVGKTSLWLPSTADHSVSTNLG